MCTDISLCFFKYPPLKPLNPITLTPFFFEYFITSFTFLEFPDELIIKSKSFSFLITVSFGIDIFIYGFSQ